MEAIVFGDRTVVIPSALEGMRDPTVTCGTVSLEQRLISWRVGWMVANADLAPTLALVHIYNAVVTSGFGQIGAARAIQLGDDDVRAAVAEWERRHEDLMRQCDGLPVVPAHGGWSVLIDAEACGLGAPELSNSELRSQRERRWCSRQPLRERPFLPEASVTMAHRLPFDRPPTRRKSLSALASGALGSCANQKRGSGPRLRQPVS